MVAHKMYNIIETCHYQKQIYDDFCKMQFRSRDILSSPPAVSFSNKKKWEELILLIQSKDRIGLSSNYHKRIITSITVI